MNAIQDFGIVERREMIQLIQNIIKLMKSLQENLRGGKKH